MKAIWCIPNTVHYENEKFFEITQIAYIVGLVVHCLALVLFWHFKLHEMAWFNLIVSIPIFVFAFIINRLGRHNLAFGLAFAELLGHQSLSIYFIGWEYGIQYWLVLLMALSFFNANWKLSIKVLCFSIVWATFLLLYISRGNSHISTFASKSEANAIYILFSSIALILLGFLINYYAQASNTIEKTLRKSETRYRHLAKRDSLTGLLNRRGFRELCDAQLPCSSQGQESFSILMLDIDFFKKINDTYGHDAGDIVINSVGQEILDSFRSKDICARYGGEEFIVLLPETDSKNAFRAAEKIRKRIQELKLSLPEGVVLSCTVSIGVSSSSAQIRGYDELITLADSMLYVAKKQGRNQCSVSGAC